MKRHFAFVFVGLITWYELAYSSGGVGVGITLPPCGIDSPPVETGICPQPYCNFEPGTPPDCEESTCGDPDYLRPNLTALGLGLRIETDLDILYSASFGDFAMRSGNPAWDLEDDEIRALARELDENENSTNPLGADYQIWDLALVFNYYTQADTLYGDFHDIYGSNLRFDDRFASLGAEEKERNHVDVYLFPGFESDGYCGTADCGYHCCFKEHPGAGTTPAIYKDDDEDPPLSDIEECPGVAEFHLNSVEITDGLGNCRSDPNWPKASAVVFDHEFEHMIQFDAGGESGLYEFFATTAEYLGDPPPSTGYLPYDICYEDPFPLRSHKYPIWRTWGVYLLDHFTNGPGIEDDLIRTWNRTYPRRDLHSLADVIDDPAYDGLGCADCDSDPIFQSQYRIQNLANRIAVARWVSEPRLFQQPNFRTSPIYGYTHGFDPPWDVGIFRKVETNARHCDWSHTIPPVYQLDLGNPETFTPKNVECYIDPNQQACPESCAPRTFCHASKPYCPLPGGCGDPIDLYPWGADVIGFVAKGSLNDPIGQTEENYYELETTFIFENTPSDCDPNMPVVPCSYRYFVNVITYDTRGTAYEGEDLEPLWNLGNRVTSVTPYGPYTSDVSRVLQFRVGDFGCSLVQSVAFVISLADSVNAAPNTGWLFNPRLDYSYTYRVAVPDVAGPEFTCPTATGCPFVHVQGPAGLLLDNNILGEAAWNSGQVPSEPDMTDEYVLSRPVEAEDGVVTLELREDGNEVTSLDSVGLVTYDLAGATGLARIVPESQVGLATIQGAFVGLLDQNGADVTAVLSELDGLVLDGDAGDYIQFSAAVMPLPQFPVIEVILVHPRLKKPPPNGWGNPDGLRAGGGKAGGMVDVLAMESEGGMVLQARVGVAWVDVAEFAPRERGETQCKSAIPGQLGDVVTLRLLWRTHHELDWIGPGLWTQTQGSPLTLVEATHSETGDITGQLVEADGEYGTMGPGERITLRFGGYTAVPGRKLCLVSRGHYVWGSGSEGRGTAPTPANWTPQIRVDDQPGESAAVAPAVLRVAAYPNPSYGPVTIETELAAGERVEISIYSTDGHLVRRLHRGPLDAGVRQFAWDGSNEAGGLVPSGQYYYRVVGRAWAKSGKLLLIRR